MKSRSTHARASRALATRSPRRCLFLVMSMAVLVVSSPSTAFASPDAIDEANHVRTANPIDEPAGDDDVVPASIESDGYLPDVDEPVKDEAIPASPGTENLPPGIGFTVGVGLQIPTGGDLRGIDNDLEMYGSGNLSFGIVATIASFLQLELFSVRGGFGGVDPDYYERLTGFDEMSSHRVWFGTHARAEIVPLGPVRPFVSAFFGADRIAATASSGTGNYVCEEGFFGGTRCNEETARDLVIGYWGWSGGFGAGLRMPQIAKTCGLVVEGWSSHAHYGRYTSSDFANVRLRDDARRVWSVGGHIALQVLSP